jgi:hypothetical protein
MPGDPHSLRKSARDMSLAGDAAPPGRRRATAPAKSPTEYHRLSLAAAARADELAMIFHCPLCCSSTSSELPETSLVIGFFVLRCQLLLLGKSTSYR